MNFVHKWSAGGVGASAAGGAGRTSGAGEVLLAGLVMANLGWTTLCLGGYLAQTMVVTVTLNAAALMVWLGLAAGRGVPIRLSRVALAALPFLVFAAVDAGWMTPTPWLGWRDWLGWAQMAAVFWVVRHGIRGGRARAVLVWGLVGLGIVAVGMALYQRFVDPRWLMLGRVQVPQFRERSSGPFGIPNSLGAFLNLLLPAMLALALQRGAGAVRRTLGVYLALLFAVGLLLTVSRGAWLSLGLALAAWPLWLGRGVWRRWLGCFGVCAVVALVVTIAYQREPEVRQRLDELTRNRGEVSRAILWRMGWELWRDRPVWGTGAGSFDVLLERYRPARFWDDPQWAHNDYLNTLSDYGIAGFLLSFGVLGGVAAWHLLRLRRDGAAADLPAEASAWPAIRTGLVIGLLAFAFQLFVDFNLKIPALAQMAAAVCALVLAPAEDEAGVAARVSWPVAVLPMAALIAALPLGAWPIYRAEALRFGARETLDHVIVRSPPAAETAALLRRAHDQLGRAVQIDPRNAQAWSDLAAGLLMQARESPARAAELGREAETAADHAVRLGPADAEFWIRRALSEDLQGRWRDAWGGFATGLRLAPHRADFWCYYAYHLSLRDLESAREALATCLSLDPWNGPALVLQKHLSGKSH